MHSDETALRPRSPRCAAHPGCPSLLSSAMHACTRPRQSSDYSAWGLLACWGHTCSGRGTQDTADRSPCLFWVSWGEAGAAVTRGSCRGAAGWGRGSKEGKGGGAPGRKLDAGSLAWHGAEPVAQGQMGSQKCGNTCIASLAHAARAARRGTYPNCCSRCSLSFTPAACRSQPPLRGRSEITAAAPDLIPDLRSWRRSKRS